VELDSLLPEKGINEIFNIGCNSKSSINELYQMTTSLASINIPSISMPVLKGDIPFSRRLDNTKAVNLLGWNPVYDLQAGLNETLKYYNGS
jgi:UDP-glucose 4-epimerase